MSKGRECLSGIVLYDLITLYEAIDAVMYLEKKIRFQDLFFPQ